MVPAILVTGFLGAGKSSLLRHWISVLPGPLGVVVNDFCSRDVDGELFHDVSDLASIAGGSIFCRCKASEWMTALGRLSDPSLGLRGILIEASGIADPSPAEAMLAASGLAGCLALRSVVTVVDPATIRQLWQTLPAVEAQVRAADALVINKCDLHAPGVVDDLEAWLRAISPAARVLRCVRGRAVGDPFGMSHHPGATAAAIVEPDPGFCRFDVSLPVLVNEAEVRAAVLATPGLLRAKGFIRTARGTRSVSFSSGGFSSEPWGTDCGLGIALVGLAKAAGHVRGCAAKLAELGPGGQA